MMKVISAPGDLVVATSGGIHVRFAGVESTDHLPSVREVKPGDRGLKVSLEGIRGPETQRRDAAFVEARQNWADQLRTNGAESAGPAPTMPGVVVLQPIQVDIKDDAGTEYRFVAGQAAGDGTEWSASWTYLPEPPENARNLYLEFSLQEGQNRCKSQIKLGL
ncbi:hypothetical protein ACFVYC_18470 [Pseudarthrobacter sp. NPDC058329]|uniref:hypothetical protein n=1 Tax=Pseudarthrobacter sp. NPDC058329 TaxID=3346448 RepID=UPI0036DB0760